MDAYATACFLWLDMDAIEAIVRGGTLEAAGCLSSTCVDLNASCAPMLARLGALTAPPFQFDPHDFFGEDSRIQLTPNSNFMGDSGVHILASACSSGAFALCSSLCLQFSSIGDAGICALAAACGRGALPRLVRLSLIGNAIGDAGVTALAGSCAHEGALPKLWDLWLSGNRIGDPGLAALARACAEGALTQLTSLTLGQNSICDAGVSAFAAVLCRGALPQVSLSSPPPLASLRWHLHPNSSPPPL